ncbi:ABC transporter ATP-binding protein [Thiohalobacter sp. IOR34]|uniref:ABC transporter ATP-binding protein n=1 Tax=Thiohalobacter sp. IOR34 TaxID=3057176 RepID=UPI0025AFB5D7|nr:ABC transporter ATP-binding protein [Thiohalobacter sp. IOR34]WJW76713.1 ABC transporter ATP-binding protein [Thiohalobacter sp. IOR34]
MSEISSDVLNDEAYTKYPKYHVYRDCAKLIFHFKPLALQLVVFGFLGAGFRMLMMYVLSGLGRYAEGGIDAGELLLIVAGVLLSGIGIYGAGYLIAVKSQDIIRDVQTHLIFSASKELCESDCRPIGRNDRLDLMLLLRQDVRAIRTIALNLIKMFVNSIYALSIYAMLVYLNWQLAVILPLLILPLLLLIIRVNKKIINESINVRAHIVRNAGTTGRFIRSLPYLRMFDNRGIAANMITSMMIERFQLRRRLAELKAFNVFLFGVAGTIGLSAIIWLTLDTDDVAELTGQYAAAFIGFIMLQQIVSVILATVGKNNEMLPIARHFFSRLGEWSSVGTNEGGKLKIPDQLDEVRYSGYRPKDSDRQITGWDFKLHPQHVYAVVSIRSPSFERMAESFTEGAFLSDDHVYINDIPINKFHPDELVKLVDIFTEDSTTFPMTIRENILLVNSKVSDDEFKEINSILKLDEAFNDLSSGLDTRVSVSDDDLSGEQLAKISLARLMLSPARIFFIDLNLFHELPKVEIVKIIDYIKKRKRAAFILVKPALLKDLDMCDRLLFFKKDDLMFDADIGDLEDKKQKHYFYINPHPDVCHAVQKLKNPDDWPTFIRAVLAYEAFVDRVNYEFDGVIKYLGKKPKQPGENLDIEIEEDSELEGL